MTFKVGSNNVWLISGTNKESIKNLNRTVKNSLNKETIIKELEEKNLTDNDIVNIERMLDWPRYFSLWGMTKALNGSNKQIWDRMRENDLVCFLTNEEVVVCNILNKIDFEKLGSIIWSPIKKKRWKIL